jgi:hypothetical protein
MANESSSDKAGSPKTGVMNHDHVPVPRDLLERMRPAVKLYALKAAQSVQACKRGELPCHYLELLQQDELKQDALLCALDDLLSIERHTVTIASDVGSAELHTLPSVATGSDVRAPVGAKALHEALALAHRWRDVYTDESHGAAGKNLGLLARAFLEVHQANLMHGAESARSAIPLISDDDNPELRNSTNDWDDRK